MKKLLWGGGAVLAVLLVAGLVTVVRAAVAPAVSCACTGPAQGTYRIWLVDGRTHALRETSVRANAVPDVALEAVRLLLVRLPTEGDGVVNLWRGVSGPRGGAPQVLSVTHRDGVVRVDLDRSVWSAPDAQVLSITPSGGYAMQQLVRTVDTALDTGDPVLLTVRGRPARGVLRYPLPGPVKVQVAGARK